MKRSGKKDEEAMNSVSPEVARERSDIQHRLLVSRFAELCIARGLKPQIGPDPAVAPRRRTRKKDIAALDSVARERTSRRHYLLEEAIADLCASNGIKPKTNDQVDLFILGTEVSVLFEVKVCARDEIEQAVRDAVTQLMEYRYLYRHELRSRVRVCIVINHRPGPDINWRIDYLEMMRIGIIWKREGCNDLNCNEFTKQLLGEILPQVVDWPG